MKGLKFAQKRALITTLLISVFLILFYSCKQKYSNETNHPYDVAAPNLDRQLLIINQGSPFKDSITAIVAEHYKSILKTVEVIDVKAFAKTEAADFDVILILYRWEAGAPPEAVQLFMDKNASLKNRMLILATSWNGLEKPKDVDAITGASIVEDVPVFRNKIIKKVDRLLKYKN